MKPTVDESLVSQLDTLLTKHTPGAHFTPVEEKLVYDTYLALQNQSETARRLGIKRVSVHNIVKRMEARKTPAELEAANQAMAAKITERVAESIDELFDSIKPEDLESGRIEERNAKGELTGYRYFGPSILQKITGIGILTDKLKVLKDYRQAAANDLGAGTLPMPENLQQLVKAIQGRVSSFQLLNVNLREEHPDLATRIDKVMEVAEIDAQSDEYVGNRPFDN